MAKIMMTTTKIPSLLLSLLTGWYVKGWWNFFLSIAYAFPVVAW